MSDRQPSLERQWPRAELDAIARLRVIEATVPGIAGVERVVDAPFDAVWSWVSDLEQSVPDFDHSVTRLQIRARRGEELDVVAWAKGLPVPVPFAVRLERGFCLMRAKGRLYLVGMAAVAEGERTRVRHVEGVPLPVIGRAAISLARREIHGDIAGIAAHFEHFR